MKTLILKNFYLFSNRFTQAIEAQKELLKKEKDQEAKERIQEQIKLLKNQETLSLQEWLNNLMLHGKASRYRTRFIKLLMDRAEEIEKERIKLGEEFASKDKEDKILYLDAENKETIDKAKGRAFKFDDENLTKFNKALDEYWNEDYKLDVTPAHNETIYGVRDIILNTEEEFGGAMAERYNLWCEAFEGIGEIKEEPEDEEKKE